MMRLTVSPVLIALGMAMIAHFLALGSANGDACLDEATGQSASAYWEYLANLLSHPGMALLTLGAPFLTFALVAMFLRAPERLVWQWIGLGLTIAALALLMSGLSSGVSCPEEVGLNSSGIPELIPMIVGGGLGFTVCLVVTYIGSIRHAGRKIS